MEVAPEIEKAIGQILKSAVFRRAGALNPSFAVVYAAYANRHAREAEDLLAQAVHRLGVCGSGPCSLCDDDRSPKHLV